MKPSATDDSINEPTADLELALIGGLDCDWLMPD